MIKNSVYSIIALALGALAFSSCSKEADVVMNDVQPQTAGLRAALSDYDAAANLPVVTVSGLITEDTYWDNKHVWEIDGIVAVHNGSKLTIQEGTFIKAKPRTDGSATGVLVVTQGNYIEAKGTATQPIVFTSYKMLDKNPATVAQPGDFGGVILLGYAPVNTPAANRWIEGLKYGEPLYQYGGSKADDRSGTLQYVRIEYAGYVIGDGNEINGLTCGGVGSGTTLDHIQVSWGKDDSFEFFGGTVNASHLISYAPDDDNFDFDNGYRGTISYALALANSTSTHSISNGKSDTNGIELDNNAKDQDATFSLQPKTHPTLNHVTIVGTAQKVQSTDPKLAGDAYKFGARIRRGGEITIQNSIITGYPMGFVVDADADKTKSSFSNCAFHGFTAPFSPAPLPAGIVGAGGSANTFGMGSPFYPVMNFTGATDGRGAFATNATWMDGWSFFK